MKVTGLSAVTLAIHDMSRAVIFYQALGFEMLHGGHSADFTSFAVGSSYLNLIVVEKSTSIAWWGRIIFYVDDVDAFYDNAINAGLRPSFTPRDAAWGERYFHMLDLDGHELSFAHPLRAAK